MLRIREEQIHILLEPQRHRYEDHLAAKCIEWFPEHCHFIGEERVHEIVHRGVAGAASMGFVAQREVALWVTLQFLLGTDFHTDPLLDWVSDHSPPERRDDSWQRCRDLFFAAGQFLDAICGEEGTTLARVMLRLERYDLQAASGFGLDDAASQIPEILESLWPQKVAMIGPELVDRLVGSALEKHRGLGWTTTTGLLLIAILKLVLGTHFVSDPLYPWAIEALDEDRTLSEGERVFFLYFGAQRHCALALGKATYGQQEEA